MGGTIFAESNDDQKRGHQCDDEQKYRQIFELVNNLTLPIDIIEINGCLVLKNAPELQA
jgi:hypothetical protein